MLRRRATGRTLQRRPEERTRLPDEVGQQRASGEEDSRPGRHYPALPMGPMPGGKAQVLAVTRGDVRTADVIEDEHVVWAGLSQARPRDAQLRVSGAHR